MVPFTPTSLQNEDIRQYRAESIFYPKAYDALTAPSFYTGSVGNRWEGGQTSLYPGRSETYYDPVCAPHPPYFAASLYPSTHVLAPARVESFEAPQAGAHHAYNGTTLQEMKLVQSHELSLTNSSHFLNKVKVPDHFTM